MCCWFTGLPDASCPPSMPYLPAYEAFTLALKTPRREQQRYFFPKITVISSRLPEGPLSFQSHHNCIFVQSLKRGGWKLPTDTKVSFVIDVHCFAQALNPHEKPPRVNGWFLQSFVEQSIHLVLLHVSLGKIVLSLCGGSGSMMEAAMMTGRGCIMFEKSGLFDSQSLY